MATPPYFEERAPLVIIGAGPAGLTACYELVQHGVKPVVVDQDIRVGGLAQTVEHRGFRFDIGGHRFFTKVPVIEGLWKSMLGSDFIQRPRLSRIFYSGQMFQYPLRPLEAVRKLGAVTTAAVGASYLRAKLFPRKPEATFEDWVVNHFGSTLYRIFFESYTEKVWGMNGRQIQAKWAAQRIKGLSLRTAVMDMFYRRQRAGAGGIKTLINKFDYPRLGPGMMWEAFRRKTERFGARVELRTRVVGVHHDAGRVTAVDLSRDGAVRSQPCGHVISSMPMRDFVRALAPAAPAPIRAAAERLRYRDFITVAIIIDKADVFPDNWIYVHERSVQVGRIQNFKNWSPDMVPDASQTCLGLEYFCSEGDQTWALSDDALVDLAKRELATLGLVDPARIVEGVVVRMRKAYPVYDDGYEAAVDEIRQYVQTFANLQLVGRNGMHKYNNQDHSMVTAMLAVRNLLGEHHDLWAINADDEYHEATSPHRDVGEDLSLAASVAATQPRVPRSVVEEKKTTT